MKKDNRATYFPGEIRKTVFTPKGFVNNTFFRRQVFRYNPEKCKSILDDPWEELSIKEYCSASGVCNPV